MKSTSVGDKMDIPIVCGMVLFGKICISTLDNSNT